VVDVVPAAVALLNTFCRYAPGRPATALVVDVARDGTDMAVISGRSLLFARSIPVGADALLGAEGRNGFDLAGWAGEVQSCLALFRSQFPGPDQAVTSAVLCGGAGAIEGLPARLAEVLGLEVRRLEELQGRGGEPEAAFFATAVGLALAGLGEGPVASSLLPPVLREERMLQGQLRYWAFSAVAAVLALGLLTLRAHRQLERERTQWSAEQNDLLERRRMSEELEVYRADIERLRAKVSTVETALLNGQLLRAVMDALGRAKAPDDWITLIADAYSYFGGSVGGTGPLEPDPGPTARPAGLQFEQVVVEGYTPVEDLSTVRAMIAALRVLPAVADADLLGDDRLREDPARDALWAPAACSLFAIEITLPTP
jgi:hypothetical protein